MVLLVARARSQCNTYREDSRVVLTSPSVLTEERIPRNGCCQCLYPQDEPQLPHASLGGFLGSANRSNSSSFQIPVSALDLGVCEILCALFESKAKCSGGSSSRCRSHRLGNSTAPLLLAENLCAVTVLWSAGRPRGVSPDCAPCPPPACVLSFSVSSGVGGLFTSLGRCCG